MNGLLLKDLYCIRGYVKQMWFILICLIVLSIYLQNPTLICFYLIFISMSILSSTISVDEKTQWDRLALTFPLRRKDVVKEKYILFLIMSVTAIFFTLLFNYLMYVLYMAVSVDEAIISSFVVYFLYMVAFCIYIPAIYKLGAEKARFVLMGILMVPLILVLTFDKLFPGLQNLVIGAEAPVIIAVLAVIVVVSFIVSYKTSLKIYTNKEF